MVDGSRSPYDRRSPDVRRPAMRAMARRWLYPAIEGFWTKTFWVAGVALRPTLAQSQFTGRDSVLVLAPHPDDEAIGCGGTIAMHCSAGDRVHVCVITDGAGSRAGGLSPQEMRARRCDEAIQASSALGQVNLTQLGLPERAWQEPQLVEFLGDLVGRVRPSRIYVTSPVDYHPEHIRVARCLARALWSETGGGAPRVRLYEVQVPLTPLLANLACELSPAAVAAKGKALRAYRSQTGSLVWLPRYSRYQRKLYRSRRPLEIFCELSCPQFSAAISTLPMSQASFRGVEPRPFADPAAWLSGMGARTRLRRSVLKIDSR